MPTGLDDLLALPGVGAYTARAVAAFAFRQRHPVVDTNVRRVFARADAGWPEASPATTVADLTAVAAQLPTDPEAAATASVAFMELGALICTARAPRCGECPLLAACAWHRHRATALPGSAVEPPATAVGPVAPAGGTVGPVARPRRSQRFVGTDRYVRGLLMAVLRAADGPVPRVQLDAVWPDPDQRARALGGLVTDGLACLVDPGGYALPGDHGSAPRL